MMERSIEQAFELRGRPAYDFRINPKFIEDQPVAADYVGPILPQRCFDGNHGEGDGEKNKSGNSSFRCIIAGPPR